MKLPRISIRAMMVGLIVIAIDCVIYRSVQSRPPSLGGNVWLYLVATLPMANILGIVVAYLPRGRAESRPARIGFASGILAAILATLLGLIPALEQVEALCNAMGIDRWIAGSPLREFAAVYGILIGLPFLFQAVIGRTGGWIGRRVGAWGDRDRVAGPPSRGVRLAAMGALVLIVAVPAVAVEAHFRRTVDPMLTRLVNGSEAVVDLKNPEVGPIGFAKGSWVHQLDGSRVRVESDREPVMIQQVMISTSNKTFIQDYRKVTVKILDGPKAGESAPLAYFLLRPIR